MNARKPNTEPEPVVPHDVQEVGPEAQSLGLNGYSDILNGSITSVNLTAAGIPHSGSNTLNMIVSLGNHTLLLTSLVPFIDELE